jgi:hypothetical protein
LGFVCARFWFFLLSWAWIFWVVFFGFSGLFFKLNLLDVLGQFLWLNFSECFKFCIVFVMRFFRVGIFCNVDFILFLSWVFTSKYCKVGIFRCSLNWNFMIFNQLYHMFLVFEFYYMSLSLKFSRVILRSTFLFWIFVAFFNLQFSTHFFAFFLPRQKKPQITQTFFKLQITPQQVFISAKTNTRDHAYKSFWIGLSN